jgi:hypothetical protein
VPSWEEAYCLRLHYSRDLKTRNFYHKSRNMGTPCHSVWMGDCHGRPSWRGWVLNTDPLRRLGSRDLRVHKGWWSVAPPSVIRSKPHCLRITAQTEFWAHGQQLTQPPEASSLLHVVCCQVGIRALTPGASDHLIFSVSSLLQGWFAEGPSLKALRPARRLLGSLHSPPPVHISVLYLLLLLWHTQGTPLRTTTTPLPPPQDLVDCNIRGPRKNLLHF